MAESQEVWLVRHAETEWSRTGKHTGLTDIELTEAGRARAREMGERLAGHRFCLVLSSPLLGEEYDGVGAGRELRVA